MKKIHCKKGANQCERERELADRKAAVSEGERNEGVKLLPY